MLLYRKISTKKLIKRAWLSPSEDDIKIIYKIRDGFRYSLFSVCNIGYDLKGKQCLMLNIWIKINLRYKIVYIQGMIILYKFNWSTYTFVIQDNIVYINQTEQLFYTILNFWLILENKFFIYCTHALIQF